MPRDRIAGLPRNTGGVVQVGSPEELAQVLAFEGTDLSSEMIDFQSALWRPVQDVRERADIYRFLTSATEQVCAAGILPRPREELAPFGTRVEVMRTGGKPPPPNRYGTGTVNGHSWISVFRTWHVHVALDQPAGTYYGQPVKGTGTCMYDIHVIGGPKRPFSSMTPTEIEELHEQRRQEFWRNIDPATGLTDPSLPRAATPKSSSTSWRNRSNSSSTARTRRPRPKSHSSSPPTGPMLAGERVIVHQRHLCSRRPLTAGSCRATPRYLECNLHRDSRASGPWGEETACVD